MTRYHRVSTASRINVNTLYVINIIKIMKGKFSSISGMAVGVLLGVIIGIAQDNIGLWISLGLAIGVAIDYTRKKESSQSKENDNL